MVIFFHSSLATQILALLYRFFQKMQGQSGNISQQQPEGMPQKSGNSLVFQDVRVGLHCNMARFDEMHSTPSHWQSECCCPVVAKHKMVYTGRKCIRRRFHGAAVSGFPDCAVCQACRGVFPQRLLDIWVEKKRKEISKMNRVPHPMEYAMYYDL